MGEEKHANRFSFFSAKSFINFSQSEQFFCKAGFNAIDSATFYIFFFIEEPLKSRQDLN